MTFTKEQLIKRIDKQIDINAMIIERLGDDSAAASELAVDTATMDIKILDIARTALTDAERAELQEYRNTEGDHAFVLEGYRALIHELNVFMNGDNAAPQSSLRDIVTQVRAEIDNYRNAQQVVMKDHQIRELVTELRDIAVAYHGTQQLRERIARAVRAAMLNGGKA